MKVTIAICSVLIAGALAGVAEEKPKATTEATAQKADERVGKVDGMVTKIEGRMAKLTRKEATLKADAVAKATDEKWTKIHTYAGDKNIERLKVYPMGDSPKTEEFYYDNGQLILVFIEPAGSGKKGHQANAKGTKYYFDDKGLFAVMSDGKVDTLDDKTREMGEKLQRESTVFLDAAK